MDSIDIKDYCQKFGDSIDSQWMRHNYNEDDFPEIAHTALIQQNINRDVHYTHLLEYIVMHSHLDILQWDCHFSDLQLTLYKNPRFYIEALYWMDGTTTIHQHGFCGAFTLLHGQSIHTEYDFTKKIRINSQFYIGNLAVKNNSILKSGEINRIYAGDCLIHSVFHLHSPTVTIVVRNNSRVDKNPQLDYCAPHVAIHGKHSDPMFIKKIRSVKLMLDHLQLQGYQLLKKLIEGSSIYDVYRVFGGINLFSLEKNQVDEISCLIADKPYGEQLLKSLSHQYQSRRLTRLRSFVKDEQQRVILAVLMNTPGKQNIVRHLLELFQCQNMQGLIKIMAEFINKGSRIGGVGYKSCESLEALVGVWMSHDSDEHIKLKINQLGEQAMNCYEGLKQSFVYANLFLTT